MLLVDRQDGERSQIGLRDRLVPCAQPGFELPNRDLARRICAIAGAPESLVGSVTDRLGHDYRYGLDDAKLRSLGWEPEIGFDEGLESTVRWYRDNASWVGSMRAEVM